jgi:gas vesicle protein
MVGVWHFYLPQLEAVSCSEYSEKHAALHLEPDCGTRRTACGAVLVTPKSAKSLHIRAAINAFPALKHCLQLMLHCSKRARVFNQRICKLINVEQIQDTTKDLATSVQTIATAHADYAKKAMQDGSEFFSQLTSVKEPAKVMELHREYAKNSYETFVAEAKKISELYTDFFKQTTKPLQDLVAKNKAA